MPPTNKRTSLRSSGGGVAKSRAGQPLDPRTEGSNGNGKSNGKGVGALGGRLAAQAKKQTAKNPRKRAGSGVDSARTHTPPTSTEAATIAGAAVLEGPVLDAPVLEGPVLDVPELDVPELDVSVPLAERTTADSLLVDAPRVPLLLPPIVPAEPEPEPEPDSASDADEVPQEPTALVQVVPPADGLATESLLETAPEFTDTDGTDGLPSLTRPKKPMRALRKPVVVPRRRPRVRKVTRVVRHVDTWSVFKVAVVFNLFLYGVCLTAGVLLWQVAQNTGTVDNIERFFESFGWEHFQLKGGEIFHGSWIAGLFVVVGLTGLAVLMATLFNLITDLVGGIRVSVLEEEVVAREERGLGWRRARRRQPEATEESVEESVEEPAVEPTAESAEQPEPF